MQTCDTVAAVIVLPNVLSISDLGSLKRRVHTQISHSNMQGVEKLLELGGSIDFRDAAERTILHRACEDVSTLTLI